MINLLKTHFGYDEFRPLQAEIIEHVLAGRDSLVLMPTGGGKSLCFQLPALKLAGLTLVVSPLIALMKDQVDALQANGIPAAFINSTLGPAEMARVLTATREGTIKILYAAPERLAKVAFRNFLAQVDVSLIAIDEAHCISEWGHDFRPDYRNLKILRQDFPNSPVLALTATATATVREDIVRQLALKNGRTFVSSFNRPNLTYIVKPKHHTFEALTEILGEHRGEATIIYCFSRRGTEELAGQLRAAGFEARAYHAGLDHQTRSEAQEKFIRDETAVIVATIAFGMGIDKPDVRLVVHYDLPKSIEGYYQETGRAGRDGLPGKCILFYSFGDKIKHDYFIERMEDPQEQARARAKLTEMVDFCESFLCRRASLLQYFGETPAEQNCANCDICLGTSEDFDATEISQKVLSAVARTGERFGAGHVIDVLRGSANQKVVERGHDRLSVHGIAAELSVYELRQIFGALSARGLLEKRGAEYPVIGVSPSGRLWLKNREELTLPKPQKPATARTAAKSRPLSPTSREGLTGQREELFQELRALRKRLADERGVPPFVIFGDISLKEMALRQPRDLDGFADIYGVGAEKLKRFATTFLATIAAYLDTHEGGRQENQSD